MEIKVEGDSVKVLSLLFNLTKREDQILRVLIEQQELVNKESAMAGVPVNLIREKTTNRIKEVLGVTDDYHLKPYLIRLRRKKVIVYDNGYYRLNKVFKNGTHRIIVICSQ